MSQTPHRNILMMDVGGTSVKRRGLPAVPVNSAGSREEISLALSEAACGAGNHDGVGVAVPGPFDFSGGIFLMDHKFASVKGESFRSLAKIPPEVEVKYIHDVAAVLEGALRTMDLGKSSTALVSIGTGLGFALAVDGKVRYSRSLSPADSIWNLPCGDGILEDKVSARGLCAGYLDLTGMEASAAEIGARAVSGDKDALTAFSRMGDTLGAAIQDILRKWKVDTLLLSGQVSRSAAFMQESLKARLGGKVSIRLCPEDTVFEGIASLFENY